MSQCNSSLAFNNNTFKIKSYKDTIDCTFGALNDYIAKFLIELGNKL